MRLIDAEALINEWNGLIKLMATNSDGVAPVNFRAVIEAVSKAPTVDAVEVVRCRECEYSMLWREPSAEAIADCLIRKMNSEDEQFCMVGADDFCSYGKRRNDETN